MGNILAFRQPRATAGKKTRKTADTAATVVIFPGVRYERDPAGEPRPKWSSAAWMAPFQPNPLPQT